MSSNNRPLTPATTRWLAAQIRAGHQLIIAGPEARGRTNLLTHLTQGPADTNPPT